MLSRHSLLYKSAARSSCASTLLSGFRSSSSIKSSTTTTPLLLNFKQGLVLSSTSSFSTSQKGGNLKSQPPSSTNKSPSNNEVEDDEPPKFLLHFGGLTIPFGEKPDDIEDLRDFVAQGLSIKKNRDCIKFFEINESKFKEQLSGLVRVRKEVTDMKNFDGVSLQAVLKLRVHPYSFLQLQEPFTLYLHDMKSSDDLATALHTYTRKYKYCYVDKISVPDQLASTTTTPPTEGTTATTTAQPKPSTKQVDVKKQTILQLIDEGKDIQFVVRTTRKAHIYRATQFGTCFLVCLCFYLFVL